MTGEIPVSVPTYEGLLDSARFFANRALRDSTSDDQFGVLLDAGTLIEHLSKALLISKNPAYLVESKPTNFDHLLHLTGQGGRAPLTGAVRTIGAYEAVTRVRRLVDIRTSQTDLDQVLQVRNGIVHAGAFDETRTRQLLTTVPALLRRGLRRSGRERTMGRAHRLGRKFEGAVLDRHRARIPPEDHRG
ncbi:hypothetical protein AB0H37_38090 [Actinomadura sp. NPDC023710]|uniref:hypothetical protein n=1 Tax=Actinomadura sp. NPDC023710 TaxID=3158219 RepID=UPI0033CEB914